ncbi:hypothetical protein [Persicobacter sp. CCB-QB2]|uniref:hypothetical protein n=1 Tax=Persicobacter sp. CCB-QB2 TaxID=1561025 RepID=UPI0006A98E6A|nr:hypothetical protein [Persicobacter sp. CCB-QB2]
MRFLLLLFSSLLSFGAMGQTGSLPIGHYLLPHQVIYGYLDRDYVEDSYPFLGFNYYLHALPAEVYTFGPIMKREVMVDMRKKKVRNNSSAIYDEPVHFPLVNLRAVKVGNDSLIYSSYLPHPYEKNGEKGALLLHVTDTEKFSIFRTPGKEGKSQYHYYFGLKGDLGVFPLYVRNSRDKERRWLDVFGDCVSVRQKIKSGQYSYLADIPKMISEYEAYAWPNKMEYYDQYWRRLRSPEGAVFYGAYKIFDERMSLVIRTIQEDVLVEIQQMDIPHDMEDLERLAHNELYKKRCFYYPDGITLRREVLLDEKGQKLKEKTFYPDGSLHYHMVYGSKGGFSFKEVRLANGQSLAIAEQKAGLVEHFQDSIRGIEISRKYNKGELVGSYYPYQDGQWINQLVDKRRYDNFVKGLMKKLTEYKIPSQLSNQDTNGMGLSVFLFDGTGGALSTEAPLISSPFQSFLVSNLEEFSSAPQNISEQTFSFNSEHLFLFHYYSFYGESIIDLELNQLKQSIGIFPQNQYLQNEQWNNMWMEQMKQHWRPASF